MVKVEEEGKVVRIGSIMCRNSGMERCSASEVWGVDARRVVGMGRRRRSGNSMEPGKRPSD